MEECAKSEKPKNVPSRPCFPLQKPSAAEFCHLCGEADTCQGCTEGYDVNIRTGRCENAKRNRLVLVTYELHALNLALDTNDWLASAFVPAFKDTVSSQITGSSLDVLNVSVSHVGLPNSYSGSTFIVTDAQNSSVKVVVAVSPSENSDASLANLTQQLTQTDFAQLADSLPKTLMKHGCTSERCQMPKDLVWTMQEPNILCPDGQWTSNQCLLPSSSGFPVWAIITISLIVLIAIAAALVWTCSKKKTGEFTAPWLASEKAYFQGISEREKTEDEEFEDRLFCISCDALCEKHSLATKTQKALTTPSWPAFLSTPNGGNATNARLETRRAGAPSTRRATWMEVSGSLGAP